MSERMKWLEHQGKDILYADYSNIEDTAELLRQIGEMEKEILTRKDKPGSIYTITDVTNIHVNDKVKARFDELAKNTAGISRARAIVGIKGVQMVIARAIKKDVYFAASVAAAKDWLVAQ